MKIVIRAVYFILIMASALVTQRRKKFVLLLIWCFLGALLYVKAFIVLWGVQIRLLQ